MAVKLRFSHIFHYPTAKEIKRADKLSAKAKKNQQAVQQCRRRMANYTPKQRKELERAARKTIREGTRKYKSRLKEGVLFDLINAVSNLHFLGWTFSITCKGLRGTNVKEGLRRTFKSERAFRNWLSRNVTKKLKPKNGHT